MSKSPNEMTPEEQELDKKIRELISLYGTDPGTFDADLVRQMIWSSLKSLKDIHDTGQLKLMTRAIKEMRYAYSIFDTHPTGRRISIFGSARTSENHPDYLVAKAFSAAMVQKGWVCMTGAADGIMRASMEGAQKEASFGLSIRLPFETPMSSYLAGDPKLIIFRYFFIRKLMFLSQSDAVAAFPGGFGTQDELFEVLTLMQTGKTNLVPVVLCQGTGNYWQEWFKYIAQNLLNSGWINEEDFNLFYLAPGLDEAVAHIEQFYRRYHSSRYVKDILVIRMLSSLTEKQIDELNLEFAPLLVKEGGIYATQPLPEEDDHLNLHRIAFEHNRQHFGLLRVMIDRINNFE